MLSPACDGAARRSRILYGSLAFFGRGSALWSCDLDAIEPRETFWSVPPDRIILHDFCIGLGERFGVSGNRNAEGRKLVFAASLRIHRRAGGIGRTGASLRPRTDASVRSPGLLYFRHLLGGLSRVR